MRSFAEWAGVRERDDLMVRIDSLGLRPVQSRGVVAQTRSSGPACPTLLYSAGLLQGV